MTFKICSLCEFFSHLFYVFKTLFVGLETNRNWNESLFEHQFFNKLWSFGSAHRQFYTKIDKCWLCATGQFKKSAAKSSIAEGGGDECVSFLELFSRKGFVMG